MTTLINAYEGMCDAIVADPTLSRNDAGVVLEGFGPTMAGTDARDWINALALEWFGLGIIATPGSYARLRDEIVAKGTVISINLFDALIARVNSLPETPGVANPIQVESLTQELATIPANIALMEGFKTGDVQLDTALDQGIFALQARESEINQQLGN